MGSFSVCILVAMFLRNKSAQVQHFEKRGEECLEESRKKYMEKVVSEISSVIIMQKPFEEQINGMVSM